MALLPVEPKSIDKALQYIRDGGELVIRTYTRVIVIDGKLLAKFEKAGVTLLKEDGDGYRLAHGKGSVYLISGQLKYCI